MSDSAPPPAWRLRSERGVPHIVFEGLEEIPWIAHAVARGGDEPGGEGGALRAALGLGGAPPARVVQVHGDAIVDAGGAAGGGTPPAERPRADGIVTATPGLPLEIRVADCVPIFAVDPARRVIGLAHAGWRGTLAGIAARLVEAMASRYGSRPAELSAWIGPSIGPECFEVGEEVARPFLERFGAAALPGPRLVDLWEANRISLVEGGVQPSRVRAVGLCTRCRGDLLHSHRGSGGLPGRNLALLALRP